MKELMMTINFRRSPGAVANAVYRLDALPSSSNEPSTYNCRLLGFIVSLPVETDRFAYNVFITEMFTLFGELTRERVMRPIPFKRDARWIMLHDQDLLNTIGRRRA